VLDQPAHLPAAGSYGHVGAPGHARAAVRLLRADDPAWDEILASVPGSVFHTAAYHRYTQGYGDGEPYLAVIGDESRGLAWPYLLRPVRGITGIESTDATDVHSVYGYPGPLAWGCGPGDPFVEDALARLAETWRAQGAVSAFTRFNPLLANAALPAAVPAGAGSLGSDGVLAAGPTVSVDLTLDDEGVRKGYGRDLPRQINVGRRAGLTTIHDTTWAHLGRFAELYAGTMTRLGAATFYFFTVDDFDRLRSMLGERVHLLVTLSGEAVAAAGLFFEQGGVTEWHLVGSSDEFRDLSPSKVLVDDAIRWARARGNRVLHMGGGRGSREDSLYWFKSRFSPQRHLFSTGRWVLEPERYEALVAAHRASVPRGREVDKGFFPAYRAPVLPDGAS
jgi:Acetyltransferase (GNAT) domain